MSALGDEGYLRYLERQRGKTTDPLRRRRWLEEEWEPKLRGFREVFARHRRSLRGRSRALCLGARTGQEVLALRELGLEAVGVDLVPCEPWVIAGDFHDLPFPDAAFDFAFSNAFDHSLLPGRFASEAQRVLGRGGLLLLQLQIGIAQDELTETKVGSGGEVARFFSDCDVLADGAVELNFAAMNWELLLEKR